MNDDDHSQPIIDGEPLTLEQACERIQELETELSQLEDGLRLTLQAPSTLSADAGSGALTISNLE